MGSTTAQEQALPERILAAANMLDPTDETASAMAAWMVSIACRLKSSETHWSQTPTAIDQQHVNRIAAAVEGKYGDLAG